MPHNHRPRRLAAMLAIAGIAIGGVLAMLETARADGDTWRDGACRLGEGQTVVIDWRSTPEALPGVVPPQLVRCIPLGEDDDEYPVEVYPDTAAVLASAEIPYEAPMGFISSVNDIEQYDGHTWHYVTGEVTDGQGNWLGKDAWEPTPGIDTFVGVTLTGNTNGPDNSPVLQPQFDPSEPTPTPTETASPSPTPSNTATASGDGQNTATPTETKGPSASPTRTASPSQTTSPSGTASATQPPTQKSTIAPSDTGSATPSATSSSTPSPQRATRPPRRTPRPQQRPNYRPQRPDYGPQEPFNPPLPPMDDNFPPPPPTEFPPPEDATGQATAVANPTPSIVWGREDVTRQSAGSSSPDTPAPWSQLAALAGAVVIVGGLGTAFARGLHTSQPPVVEEE